MTHFLYRPHVKGPENNITTPDIVIDRVRLLDAGNSSFVPVHRLSTGDALQVFAGDMEVTPAYALVAGGGGVLLGLAVLIRQTGESLAKADAVVARSAWRLRNVADHFASLRLSATTGDSESGTALSQLAQPGDIMTQSAGDELALPRGIIVLCAATGATVSTGSPAVVTVELADASLDRTLSNRTGLVPVDSDRWDERPLPRYTVGPIGEVQHYI